MGKKEIQEVFLKMSGQEVTVIHYVVTNMSWEIKKEVAALELTRLKLLQNCRGSIMMWDPLAK